MSPEDRTVKKATRVIITIFITTNFAWSTNATGDDRTLLQKVTEDVTVPMLNAIIRPIINPIGNTIIKNAELDREFRPRYKRTTECEKVIDVETMQKCTDDYKNARADFARHKETIKINNKNEIIRLQKVIAARQARKESLNTAANPTRPRKTQPECFEKSTGKRVSCGNDYITEKAASAASNR